MARLQMAKVSIPSNVNLLPAHQELIERLARHTHAKWAGQMVAKGWQYGDQRDSAHKRDPRLLPFDRLSKSQRRSRRLLVEETVRSILALGYEIEPARTDTAFASQFLEERKRSAWIRRLLKGDASLDLQSSLNLWQTRVFGQWSQSPRLYQELARHLLRLGELKTANEVVTEGLSNWPDDVVLRQAKALTLARSGATSQAMAELQVLYDEGHRDEETLGIIGRTYKDFAQAATDKKEKKRYLRSAFEIYHESFQNTGGYYAGVNAATTALLAGDSDQAEKLARRVRDICLSVLEAKDAAGENLYWITATLAEVMLILGQWGNAVQWYADAVSTAPQRWGDHLSMRRNARILMDHMGIGPLQREKAEACFRIPKAVLFVGRTENASSHTGLRFFTKAGSCCGRRHETAPQKRRWPDRICDHPLRSGHPVFGDRFGTGRRNTHRDRMRSGSFPKRDLEDHKRPAVAATNGEGAGKSDGGDRWPGRAAGYECVRR